MQGQFHEKVLVFGGDSQAANQFFQARHLVEFGGKILVACIVEQVDGMACGEPGADGAVGVGCSIRALVYAAKN